MNHRNDSRPPWAFELSTTLVALSRSRLALRRAARRVDDRRLSQRLLRLARRKRAAAADLHRAKPVEDLPNSGDAPSPFPSQMAAATDIGSLAACLRANRRLATALTRTLAADPPPSLTRRLSLLLDETHRDAAQLTSRLNTLIVAQVPATTSHPEATVSNDPVDPAPTERHAHLATLP